MASPTRELCRPPSSYMFDLTQVEMADPLPHLALDIISEDDTAPSEYSLALTANSSLELKLAKVCEVLNHNRDAIVSNLGKKVAKIIECNPQLQTELKEVFPSLREVETEDFLKKLHNHFIFDFENEFNFELVGYPELTQALKDYAILDNFPSAELKHLSQKIDLAAIAKDINGGGSSTLHYIGKGIWISGKILYHILRFSFTLLSFTPIVSRVVIVAGRLLLL